MDLFDSLEETQTQTVQTTQSSTEDLVEFTDDMITKVLEGGRTAKEEAERPFWKFPKVDYPYDHHRLAYLCSFGDKGAGKTTTAMSVSGNVLAITFENRANLTLPWSKFFKYNPRFQIFSFAEHIDRTHKGTYRDTSNESYLQIVNLMNRARALEQKFDWVIIDGLQAGQKLAEQRMRSVNNEGAFSRFKNLSLWGERSMYFENVVMQLSSQVASKGVYLTSQNVLQKAMFLTEEQKGAGKTEEDIPVKEPKWKDKIKDDVHAVIYHTIQSKDMGKVGKEMHYKAEVSTNKLGSTGAYDLTLSVDNPKATTNFIKDVLTQPSEFVIE